MTGLRRLPPAGLGPGKLTVAVVGVTGGQEVIDIGHGPSER
jgi:hypothetical protein